MYLCHPPPSFCFTEELSDSSVTSTDVSQAAHVTVSHNDQITALTQLPAASSDAHNCTSGTEHTAESQPVWEMEVVMQDQAAQGLDKPDHKASCVDVGREQDLTEDGVGQLGMVAEGLGADAVPSGYECVVVTQALMDRPTVQSGDGSCDAGDTLLQANPEGAIPVQGQAGERAPGASPSLSLSPGPWGSAAGRSLRGFRRKQPRVSGAAGC